MVSSAPVQTHQTTFLLQNYQRLPVVVDSGQGCYVFDIHGKRYLDVITGIGVNALGYAHPGITTAIIEQAQLCIHTSNLVSHRYQEKLARKLCAIAGMDRVFFANSGTEAMEAALKAVRAYGRSLSKNKFRVVALHNSFHGRTMGSLAITGQPTLRRPFEPFGGAVSFIAPNNKEAIEESVSADTAAIVLEPVLGEGGIYPLSEEFLQRARQVASEFGALLVLDETQSGLGRTGRYFAYQWAGIQPDILVTAKPLAAGLPLGATLFTESVARFLPVHAHGTTFGGGPLACRVALEFLSVLDGLLPQIRNIGAELLQGLRELKQRHPVITEIRAKGMMFGIQLCIPGHSIVSAALERGLLLNCTHETVLRLLPPYILTSEQVGEVVRILDEVLTTSPQPGA
jgi:acetylornithine/N-succinyldiaminopimelate aminotransferase